MRFLERFLVMLAAISLALFFFDGKKTAGMLIISMGMLTFFYLIGSYFLLTAGGRPKLLPAIGAVLCGLVFSYAVASLLMLLFGKMTPAAIIINNGLFLGITVVTAGIDRAVNRQKIAARVLWRAVPLLLFVTAGYLFYKA